MVILLKLAVAAVDKFLNVPAPLKVCVFVEGVAVELKKLLKVKLPLAVKIAPVFTVTFPATYN